MLITISASQKTWSAGWSCQSSEAFLKSSEAFWKALCSCWVSVLASGPLMFFRSTYHLWSLLVTVQWWFCSHSYFSSFLWDR